MNKQRFSVYINTVQQLKAAISYKIDTLYIPFDMFYNNTVGDDIITKIHTETGIKVYIALPEIIRLRDEGYLNCLKDFLLLGKADGILVKNLEEVGYINSISDMLEEQYISVNGKTDGYTPLMLEADYSLYNWNKQALSFIHKYCPYASAPLELSIHELKELDDNDIHITIFGKAPLMVSSNCIRKTCGECANSNDYSFDRNLNDRKNKSQLVYRNCIHCFNKLYNNVPTSFHKQMYDLIKAGFYYYRLDFTNETVEEMNDILSYYINEKRAGAFPVSEYTTGHILKGAI